MPPIKYYASLLLYFAPLLLLSQVKKTVFGSVKDTVTQKGIENALVRAMHGRQSTYTDEFGNFYLDYYGDDTVLITATGYRPSYYRSAQPKVPVAIYLSPVRQDLDSVVVSTGYQTIHPNESNGSFAVIDNKMLNLKVGLNILDRLNGVASSLLVNMGKHNNNGQNSTNISIRGLSTINGPLDPLIVLDNFIYEGDINNINPNDVENITVLKDAAAASIWGARAGNGVIVITTKKGRFRQKMSFDFNTTYSVQSKPDLYYLPQMSNADYIEMEQFLFNKGYFNSKINAKPYYQALTPAVEVFLARRNGQISAVDSASRIKDLENMDGRAQYLDYVYRKAVTQQYALNLRGGGDNLAWLVSGTYDKNAGTLRTQYSRLNFRTENTYRPLPNLTLKLGAYYTSSNTNAGIGGYKSISIGGRYIPYMQLADGNGTPVPVASQYRLAYTDTSGGGKLLNWGYVPLNDYRHNTTNTNLDNIIGNVGLQYTLLDGLDINLLYQYQKQRTTSDNLADTASFYARNLINLYSQINRTTGKVTYIVPVGGILSRAFAETGSQNARAQLNFSKRTGLHSINAIAGMEMRQVSTTGSNAKYFGYNADPLTYTNVDVVNRYPTYITGSQSSIGGTNQLSHVINRFISAYTNFSYAYKGLYTFSGSIRKDGANIFGAGTNDRWKPLWSAGLGWKISDEPFYHFHPIPYLKLVATTGASGNVDVSKSALAVATAGTNSVTQLPIERIMTLNNPELRWEQSLQTNFRLEFASRGAIVAGSLEFYLKKGKDLYGNVPYDYTAWGYQSSLLRNVANMSGQGWDITLNTKNMQGAFNWETQLLFSFVNNKTTKYLYATQNNVSALIGGGTTIFPLDGYPLYALAAYKWAGLDNAGNPQGFIDGQKSTDYTAIAENTANNPVSGGSLRYFGSASPKYFGALLNNVSWENLSLSFNITYKFGYYLFKPALNYYQLTSGYNAGTEQYKYRWQQPGDENHTTVPSFQYPANSDRDAFYGNSEINVIKGDHVRLQFINMSYGLPVKNKKSLFKSLSVYAVVSNLGIIWRSNKDRIDPDYVNVTPDPKIFSAGIRTNF